MQVEEDPGTPTTTHRGVKWVLRIGVAGTFAGHGLYALMARPAWIPYLMTVGFSSEMALKIMPVIGVIDLTVALMALFKPLRIVFLWAACWAFLAATIRPLSGESILEFVERASLWAVPLAYLFLAGFPRKLSDLFKT